MNKAIKFAAILNSIALLIIAFMLLLFWLASAHINFKDYHQLKILFEVGVFAVGSILLLIKRNRLDKFNWSLFLALVLIVVSFPDLYFEVRSVDFSKESPPLILILLALVFIASLTFLIDQVRKLKGI